MRYEDSTVDRTEMRRDVVWWYGMYGVDMGYYGMMVGYKMATK